MVALGDDLVTVGVITGAHGIRGEVKLKSFTEIPEDIASYDGLVLATGTPVTISKLTPAKAGFIARLKGVDDRNAAEALKGTEIKVPKAALPEAEDGEFYHADLIGLQVRQADGTGLGKVIAVHDFGAGDLIDVELVGTGKSVLLPFDEASVPEVNLAEGWLSVDPPDGLLED